jgi:hypothetical protein
MQLEEGAVLNGTVHMSSDASPADAAAKPEGSGASAPSVPDPSKPREAATTRP